MNSGAACERKGSDVKDKNIDAVVPLCERMFQMSSQSSKPDWTLVRCSSFEDMRRQAVLRWQRVSATARSDAAWEMVREAWALKKRPAHELRLQRTVTVLRKA